tara:strand:- start:262 stop:444 length:183 start_codon:yes stop_codon:yes gene_type:complete
VESEPVAAAPAAAPAAEWAPFRAEMAEVAVGMGKHMGKMRNHRNVYHNQKHKRVGSSIRN